MGASARFLGPADAQPCCSGGRRGLGSGFDLLHLRLLPGDVDGQSERQKQRQLEGPEEGVLRNVQHTAEFLPPHDHRKPDTVGREQDPAFLDVGLQVPGLFEGRVLQQSDCSRRPEGRHAATHAYTESQQCPVEPSSANRQLGQRDVVEDGGENAQTEFRRSGRLGQCLRHQGGRSHQCRKENRSAQRIVSEGLAPGHILARNQHPADEQSNEDPHAGGMEGQSSRDHTDQGDSHRDQHVLANSTRLTLVSLVDHVRGRPVLLDVLVLLLLLAGEVGQHQRTHDHPRDGREDVVNRDLGVHHHDGGGISNRAVRPSQIRRHDQRSHEGNADLPLVHLPGDHAADQAGRDVIQESREEGDT